MCGILGGVNVKNQVYFNDLLTQISHRGPDDEGLYCTEGISLGHQRLSILDLSPKGHQPMFSKNERYVIIFNGEIYNHIDIRAELEKKYEFTSTTDTETILYGYIEYGKELFNLLNGIFALAIYDIEKRDLIIVRDHFGIKPLYYYQENDVFLFSSELKAISKLEGTKKDLNYSAFVSYINFLWSPGKDTPFKHFKKLLPGHYISLNIDNPKDFEIKKYYDIPFSGNYKQQSEKLWIDELDEALQKAVERQLLSDVPVGFFLSGGLDSSLIVAIAAKIMGHSNFNCYTIKTEESIDFEGFANDIHYARKVAQYIGVNLIEVDAKVDIVENFDKMIWHLDEPQADAAPINVLNICKEARNRGDIVLLGGTAGDDLFSGYRRHQALEFEKYFKLIPAPIGRFIKQITHSLAPKTATIRRIRKITANLDKTTEKRMASYYQWLPLEINKQLFNTSIQKYIKDINPLTILTQSLENIPNEKDKLNQMLYWDMKYFLTDHNLNYTDKMSMAVGVEVRVPFLDKELVELSTKIPTRLKLKGNITKYLLKKVAERYLPKEVIYRPKTGFGAPVRKWITNDLDEMINDRLSEKRIKERGIFNSKNVSKLIQDNKKGKIDASYPIWGLLAIESWMQQFVD